MYICIMNKETIYGFIGFILMSALIAFISIEAIK